MTLVQYKIFAAALAIAGIIVYLAYRKMRYGRCL